MQFSTDNKKEIINKILISKEKYNKNNSNHNYNYINNINSNKYILNKVNSNCKNEENYNKIKDINIEESENINIFDSTCHQLKEVYNNDNLLNYYKNKKDNIDNEINLTSMLESMGKF